MANFSIKLNMLAFKNAGIASLTGKSGAKKCLIIPIEENNLFQGQSGLYISMIAWRSDKLKDGKTHLIKPSFSREDFESMTDLEKKAIPIVGDLKPMGTIVTSNTEEYNSESLEVVGSDDLPF